MSTCIYDGEDATTSVEALPLDFLRFMFAHLSARDLCAAACTCRLWDHLTREYWRDKCFKRWKHGSTRWAPLVVRGQWKELYRERHLLDRATRSALRDLPWPVRREGALAVVVETGEDALDQLLLAATGRPSSSPSPRRSSPASTAASADSDGNQTRWGRRYWAEQALAAVCKRQAVRVLSKVAKHPRAAEMHPERGALAIAQAHYPTVDLGNVEVELAALGAELGRRLGAQGAAQGSLQALRILNHLLFGPPAEQSPTASTPSPRSYSASSHTSSSSPSPSSSSVLLSVVGADGGLGLSGCSDSDYYNASNSMLPDVLARRRGIPISLALLHLAMARRGGLGGRLELIGLPTRVVNRFIPASGSDAEGVTANGAPGCKAASGDTNGSSGGDGEREEVFIDVFAGGALYSWSELRSRMAVLGVAIQRSHVRALTPAQTYERVTANLYGIYRDAGDLPCLRLALELRGVVAEQSRDLLSRRYRVSLALEDWTDATECLDALTAGLALGGQSQQPHPHPQQHPQQQPHPQPVPQPAEGPAAAGSGGGVLVAGTDGMDEHVRQQMAAHLARLRRDLDDRRSEWQSGSVTQKHRPPAVLYAVGTLVQHRTYGYRGVIVDWDTSCRMDEQWIAQMGVDALPGGRHQPFYRVLVSDRGRSSRSRDRRDRRGGGEGGRTAAALVGGRQVWQAEGPASELLGLHNRPRAEETYVAQANIHVVVPAGRPEHEAPTAAAPAPPGPYDHLGPLGVTTVAVSYDFQIQHPDLGRYFEGKRPGAPRYRLNAAMRHRFPGDWDDWDGWESGEDSDGSDEWGPGE